MCFVNKRKLPDEDVYICEDHSFIPILYEAMWIRERLERKGYMLDVYLSIFQEAAVSLSDNEVCWEDLIDVSAFQDFCRRAAGQRPPDFAVQEVYDENGWISPFLQGMMCDPIIEVEINRKAFLIMMDDSEEYE
mgnify:CR=1 FL=1